MTRTTDRPATAGEERRDDEGFTLTELIVSMAVLSVVMLLVTGAVLLASGTSARVDAASVSQQQAHQAFDTLDRQVRWAAGFSKPGRTAGADYVEWLSSVKDTPTCNELRLDPATRKLQLRSWTQGKPTTVSAWKVLASNATVATGRTAPFTTTAPTGSYTLARLQIAVTATAGGAKGTDTATHDVTYTALNSRGATVPDTVCTEGRTYA